MRDVILAIRADEAHHRVVNHTLSSIHLNEKNPFSPGQKKLWVQYHRDIKVWRKWVPVTTAPSNWGLHHSVFFCNINVNIA